MYSDWGGPKTIPFSHAQLSDCKSDPCPLNQQAMQHVGIPPNIMLLPMLAIAPIISPIRPVVEVVIMVGSFLRCVVGEN
jgi:hypothetical protein